jgi:hypothetical protein
LDCLHRGTHILESAACIQDQDRILGSDEAVSFCLYQTGVRGRSGGFGKHTNFAKLGDGLKDFLV